MYDSLSDSHTHGHHYYEELNILRYRQLHHKQKRPLLHYRHHPNQSSHNREEKKMAADAMEKMQIAPLAKRCYRTLSGGQQQRVLLSRALCATRKMLLLDEPVSGLDPKVTAEMYALIQKLNYEDGITVVMISHDLCAALQYASHILHIGDKVFFGTKAAYLNEFPQAWQKGGGAQ